jgi:hypothetical protein
MEALTTVQEPAYQLTKPDDILKFSTILRDFITKSQLSTKIQGSYYANVDGWKFAGLNFGLVPLVSEPIERHIQGQVITILYHEVERRFQNGKKRVVEPFFSSINQDIADKFREKYQDRIVRSITTDYFNYKCGCDVQNTITGIRVGSGFGLCSNLELAKSSFDEFAVMSMAQTRAIGRSFKNVIGFIMKASGYAETPAEEMDGQQKAVVVDEGTMIDIESALIGVTTMDELTRLWNDLNTQTQASAKVINMFKKKKIEIASKK